MANKDFDGVEEYLHLAESIASGFFNIPHSTADGLKQNARFYLLKARKAFVGTGRPEAEFPQYAAMAIRNSFIDEWKKEIRLLEKTITVDEDGEDILERVADMRSSADVVNRARQAESDRILHETLKKLPSDERAVLIAVMNDESYGEIGKKLGISKQAASNRYWKAIKNLRQMLGEKGYVDATSSGKLATSIQKFRPAAKRG